MTKKVADKEEKIAKRADIVLKNYRNFKKVANMSDEPFSKHGEKLSKQIEHVIDDMLEPYRSILFNWYLETPKQRQSRRQFCNENKMNVEEYKVNRKKALIEFATFYLDGSLLDF